MAPIRRIVSRPMWVLQFVVVNPTRAGIKTWNFNPNSIFPAIVCSKADNLSSSREEFGLFQIGWIVENNSDFWGVSHCRGVKRLELIGLPRDEVDWWRRKIWPADILSHDGVLLPF